MGRTATPSIAAGSRRTWCVDCRFIERSAKATRSVAFDSSFPHRRSIRQNLRPAFALIAGRFGGRDGAKTRRSQLERRPENGNGCNSYSRACTSSSAVRRAPLQKRGLAFVRNEFFQLSLERNANLKRAWPTGGGHRHSTYGVRCLPAICASGAYRSLCGLVRDKVDITIRRPRMMMAGSVLLGISLIVLRATRADER
jgi:hypothetical protein